ncbi:glycosyltransferase family 8 protein [Psychrobacillus sp. PGGUH221]|uniref:glycosyltransferase n=1 Tax=Psychrobacillus sp. PGGUH221 TaxID=3020058 RepID=UPI0035C687CA
MAQKNIHEEINTLDSIHLVVTIDQNFLQHFYVMFKSLLENTDLQSNTIHLHLIHHSIEEKELTNIQKFFSSNQVRIEFYEIELNYLKDFNISEHISLATYYRILIPYLLNNSIQKVIYLDSDMVICKNIRELWSYDIQKRAIGAVIDLQGKGRMEELRIPDDYSYFNAGVLIINLQYWRENNISEKVIDFIKLNPEKLKYWDQDALNAILYDKFYYLPYCWNIQTNAYKIDVLENEIRVALKEPCIIHYTTASKPWHITNVHPLKEKYHFFLERTPYKKYTMFNNNTTNILNNKKRVFIFGAGETGQIIMNFLKDYKNIEGFIDNDLTIRGMERCGKLIYSLNEIKETNFWDIGVIVSSGHYKSIAEQLKQFGLVEKLDFVHQM